MSTVNIVINGASAWVGAIRHGPMFGTMAPGLLPFPRRARQKRRRKQTAPGIAPGRRLSSQIRAVRLLTESDSPDSSVEYRPDYRLEPANRTPGQATDSLWQP